MILNGSVTCLISNEWPTNANKYQLAGSSKMCVAREKDKGSLQVS